MTFSFYNMAYKPSLYSRYNHFTFAPQESVCVRLCVSCGVCAMCVCVWVGAMCVCFCVCDPPSMFYHNNDAPKLNVCQKLSLTYVCVCVRIRVGDHVCVRLWV